MAARQVPNPGDRTILDQLDSLARQLEEHCQADVLTLSGPMRLGLDSRIRDAVEKRTERRDCLWVVLETVGGYVEPVERIVEVMRRHYGRVEFVVPDYAMSAGTILCMSGDAIHMDYFSVLGPIDPQLPRPEKQDYVPALGYLIQYDRLIEDSKERPLTPAEMAYLIEKFDPGELYRYEQERDLSEALLEEWLSKYKFQNWTKTETSGSEVTEEMRRERAREIAETLNDPHEWHSHGRGITMEVLRSRLNLKVDDFGADPTLAGRIKAYHELIVDYAAKMGHVNVIHRPGFHVGYQW